MEFSASTAGEVGHSSKYDNPWSQHLASCGSIGILPKNGTCISFAIAWAPPVVGVKIWVSFLQLGQTNPLIFSTTPRTRTWTFLQKLISFLTSNKATSCGVVTITAPSMPVALKYWTIDKCSSDVPGGVSTTK